MDEMTRLQASYRDVFCGSESGVMVLGDILSMLGYFSNVPDKISPERMAIANTILSRLNVFGSNGVNDYVRTILMQAKPPVIEEEEEDDE